MANPFEDTESPFRVVVNGEGQHSLWPASLQIPDGWEIVCETSSRAHCIDFIEENWTDMRPQSLVRSTRN